MILRDYQSALITEARLAMRTHRSVFVQLPTGGGKTAIISEITRLSFAKGFRVWFVVPRNELLLQASDHFQKWGIPHGLIAAGVEESRAFKVHIVSKDTLLRRLDRIKNWPDFIIFDEGHIALDAQIKIVKRLPEHTKIMAQSATPERLDGRGLSEVYDAVVYGPSIPWLTDRGFLSPLRYFAPPIEGLSEIHRKGTEFDADELDELYKKRAVYGSVVDYYKKYGRRADGVPMSALIFCRSVKSAYDVAERFRTAGYRFECIEGAMPDKRRRDLVQALKEGTIDGLTNCELATYGLDVPRVEYGASIRPTLSRALYFQMVGRILRPFPGKDEALFFDHANLIQEHTDPENPGVPLFYLPDLTWNFSGREKRERAASLTMKLCPYNDYQYCGRPDCHGCQLKPDAAPDPRREALPEVDATLEERKAPASWSTLAPEEKRDIQDRIGRAADLALQGLAFEGLKKGASAAEVEAYKIERVRLVEGPIGELLAVATELGRSPMWVYHFLVERTGARAVNVPLLHEIARQKNYAKGWIWYKMKELRVGAKEGVS